MIRVVSSLVLSLLLVSSSAAAEALMVDDLTGMQLVRLPAGCLPEPAKAAVAKHFVSVVEQAGVLADEERVAHDGRICFGKDFWMARYEVTQAQFEKVMGNNPSSFKRGGDYPVERVSWFEVQQFIRKLNEKTGKQFRLPSESEWIYAAMAGAPSSRFGAEGKPGEIAWYMNNSSSTHPVGTKQANAFGLFDMSGNVWEWTSDCWNENRAQAPADGSAVNSGRCSARVLKGGSWYDAEKLLYISARLWNDSNRSDNNSGFRLVHD